MFEQLRRVFVKWTLVLVVVLVHMKKCSGNGGGGTVAAAVRERLFGRASQLTAKERDPTSI
jgi:hypothetical protein